MFSKRILDLSPSPTLALDAKVRQMQKDGASIINLALGEPDFDTPKHIQKAAIRAIREGFTHYTTTSGILDLREAICHKLLKENDLYYKPQEIVVGVGSKQLLYHVFQVLCDDDDEVIVPTPTWSTYVEQIKLAGANPVFVPLEPPYKLMSKDLIPFISSKTKIIILNSPVNPTGAMIEKEELKKIAKLASNKNIFIVSDEIYEKILYGKRHYSIASFDKKIKNLTVTINGFSKAYAMTGWRIGYAAGPVEIIKAMTDLQSQTTSNTFSISQKAAHAALCGTQVPIKEMVSQFKKRRLYLVQEMKKIKDFDFTSPDGAFYFFVSIKKLLGEKYVTSKDWCLSLLERGGVAVVPGEAFLCPGCVRISFAASMNDLHEALKRTKRFIEKYGK